MGKRSKRLRTLLTGTAKWCLFAGVMLFSLVLICASVLRLYLSDARLKRLVENHLRASLRQQVTLQGVHLRLRRGLRVDGLIVRDPSAQGAPPLLTLAKLAVRYKLAGIFPPKLTVEGIEVASPHLYIEAKPAQPPGLLPWPAELAVRLPLAGLPDIAPAPEVAKAVGLAFGVALPLAPEVQLAPAWLVRVALGLVREMVPPVEPAPRLAAAIALVPRLVLPIGPHEAKAPPTAVPGIVAAALKFVPPIEFRLKSFSLSDVRVLLKSEAGELACLTPPDVKLSLGTKLSLADQRFDLECLDLSLGAKSQIQVQCAVTELLGRQVVDLRMKQCTLDLGELFQSVRSLAPDMSVAGLLCVPTLSVQGPVVGPEPMRASLALRLQNMHVACPEFGQAEVKGLSVSFDVPHASLVDLFPKSASARLAASILLARYDRLTLRDVTEKLVLAVADMAQKGNTITLGKASVLSKLDVGSLALTDKKLGVSVSDLSTEMRAGVDQLAQCPNGLAATQASAAATVTTSSARARLDEAALTASVSGLAVNVGSQVTGIDLAGSDVRIERATLTQSFGAQAVAACAAGATLTVGPLAQSLEVQTQRVAASANSSVLDRASAVSQFRAKSLTVDAKGLRLRNAGLATTLSATIDKLAQDGERLSADQAAASIGAGINGAEVEAAGSTAKVGRAGVMVDAKAHRLRHTQEATHLSRGELRQSFHTTPLSATAAGATLTAGPLAQDVWARVSGLYLSGPRSTVEALDANLGASLAPVEAIADTGRVRVESLSEKLAVHGRKLSHTVTSRPETDIGSFTAENLLSVAAIQASAAQGTASIREVSHKLTLTAAGRDAQVCDLFMSLSVPQAAARHLDFGDVSLPLSLSIRGESNLAAKRLSDLAVALRLGECVSVGIRARADGFGRDSLWVRSRVGLDLTEAARLITPQIKKRVGDIQVEGSIGVVMEARGKLDPHYQPDPVDAELDLTARVQPLGYKKTTRPEPSDEDAEPREGSVTAMGLGSLSLDLHAGARYAKPGLLGPADVYCDARLRDLTAHQGVLQAAAEGSKQNDRGAGPASTPTVAASVSYIKLRLSTALDDAVTLTPAPAGATTVTTLPALSARVAMEELDVQGASFRAGEMHVPATDLAATLTASADTRKQRYTLEGLRLEVGNMLRLSSTAWYSGHNSQFEAKLHQYLNLPQALGWCPSSLRRGLPTIKTNAVQRLDFSAAGRVPSAQEIRELRLPLNVTSTLTLEGDVSLPDEGIHVAGLAQTLELSLASQEDRRAGQAPRSILTLRERLAVTSVRIRDLPPTLALSPRVSLDLRLEDFDALSLSLTARPNQEVDLALKANADGLRTMVTRRGPSSLHDVFAHINGSVTLDFEAGDLRALSQPNMRARGSVSVHASAGLLARESAFARARLEAAGASLSIPGALRVDRLDAQIAANVEKGVEAVDTVEIRTQRPEENLSESFLGKVQSLLAARSRTSAHDLYGDLRTYVDRHESLRIARVESGPYRVEDFTLDLNFDRGVWIDQISMSLLGGSVAGRVGAGVLDGRYVLGLAMEFTGLNGKSLLPFLDRSVTAREAEVSGNFMVAARLGSQKHLSLDDIEMAVNVTKVGPKALDAFLRAQDPYESDPNIVAVRRYIALGGRPTRIAVRVLNGEMRQDVRWKPPVGPSVSLPLPDSVPLGKIMDLSVFDGVLKALDKVQGALQVLAASKIRVDKAGSIRWVE